MRKVLLVNMPYGAPERPALGLSLLKPVLAAAGFPCEVRYLNLSFADLLGLDRYRFISAGLPYTAFAGDWTFAHLLYGTSPRSGEAYLDEVLRNAWFRTEEEIGTVREVRTMAGVFLEHCLAAIPWRDYGVVGFTSTFEQNIASLALARRVKRLSPGTAIVFGGANWEGEMGLELHRRFRFVDYACRGEAEESLPRLVDRIFSGAKVDDIPGIVHRSGGESRSTGPPSIVRDMDTLPFPDYRDYFHHIERSAAGSEIAPTLLFESSRGCWWGEKKHCTFCGLNGGRLSFRSKSAGRVQSELEHLLEAWGLELVEFVDNILDMKYFRELLPALSKSRRPVQIFCEVKANLGRSHIEQLRDAGVNRIQPGIESLNDHVLSLMRKGTTALRNIQMLKWCAEYGIGADWNLLYGFPGETEEDYREMLGLLPAIRFLGPPAAWGPVRLDRFSPFHESPESFGIRNIRPMAPYRHLYPFGEDSLSRIASCFEYDFEPGKDTSPFSREVVAFLEQWKREPEAGSLQCEPGADGSLVLYDSRSDATLRELSLSGAEREAYGFCDSFRPVDAILRHLREARPEWSFTPEELLGFLDSMVANRLMVTDGTNYLSLALRSAASRDRTEDGAAVPALPV